MALAEYDGTAYHGWQVQPGLSTVQGTIDKAIAELLGESCKIDYASRTDKGVHSKGQIIAFSCPDKFSPERIEKAVNYYLPDDIILKKVRKCPDHFHPRYDNKGKLYIYRILNARQNDIMLRNYAWHIPYSIDWKILKKGLKKIKGTHDFSLFSSGRGGEKKTIINIRKASLSRKGDIYFISYKADYFLMHMIRHITGFLIAVGTGKEKIEVLEEKLKRRGDPCSRVAPAKGLELKKVYL